MVALYWIFYGTLLLGLLIGVAMTFLGLLAPFLPPLEMVNHFRPYTLFGVVVLLILAALSKAHRHAMLVVVLSFVNIWLLVDPLRSAAKATQESSGSPLKLVTFNVWGGNSRLDAVADFLLHERADVVLLQEMTTYHRQKLLPRLSALYPHVLTCDCQDMVLLAQRPWLDAGSQPMTERQPPTIWARFADGKGGHFRLVGLHAAFPFHPWRQARHYEWMIRELPKIAAEPLIVAGDFNMSPWSYGLRKLAASVGLVRHGTWARSWPARRTWHTPFVLLDNVLTSPGVRAVSFETGPPAGSDHLPIVATLRLP
ncbi:MAG: endonuclease/exonuclease/phosphatase family protein [Hyphomicrobiaceae bacterium]